MAGSYYSLLRTVEIIDGKVKFEDLLTNLNGSNSVGILVQNKITTEQAYADTLAPGWAANPSYFLTGATVADDNLGVLLEDSFSRMHYQTTLGVPVNQARFKVNDLALAGTNTQTLKWTMYPFDNTADHFTFFNKVREDWGTNFTVDGPFAYLHPDDASGGFMSMPWQDPVALKAHLERRRLGVVTVLPFLDYDPGYSNHVWTRSEYQSKIGPVISAFKAADPDIKVIGAIESDWVAIDPNEITNGHLLPSADVYGVGDRVLTTNETNIILNAIANSELDPWDAIGGYTNSLKRNADGNLTLELYMRGGVAQTALAVYPEALDASGPGNHQYEYLMEQIDFLINTMGMDGVYIDQFSMVNSTTRTYGQTDGRSGTIDSATGAITVEYFDANLEGISARVNLSNAILDAGKIVVANTYSTSAEEQALPINRFSEVWNAFDPMEIPDGVKPPTVAYLMQGSLASPIALGVQTGNELAKRVTKAVIGYLSHGLLYYHYHTGQIPETGPGSGEYGPINNMFPITPVELHEGWIVGQERTITTVSGEYQWKGSSEPKVMVFDNDERSATADFSYSVTGGAGAWNVSLTIQDWDDIAIITSDDPATIPGDANGDGVVSADDYGSVQLHFGDTGVPGIPGDATGDGMVSADDYASVQSNFGNVAGMGGIAAVFGTSGLAESNNAYVDLGSTPNQIAKGTWFYTPVMVTNRGNIAITPSESDYFMTMLYYSTEDDLVAAVEGMETSLYYATASMWYRAPGQSHTMYLWAHADEDTGTYNLRVLTDVFDSVLETDETNNWSTLFSGKIV